MTRPDASWRTAIVAALLVAFLLRAHRLDGMSLWSDEDITADRASMAAGEMLAGLPAEHTPVYFLSMIPWTRAAGGSDFALRYPSLMAGVLAVAASAAVGAALAGRKAAIVLAIVMAVNPFLVWYGQEARMYALLSALGLLSLGAALVARRTGRVRWWVATGVLAALTVLVHYYGALALAVLSAWAVIDWRAAGQRGGSAAEPRRSSYVPGGVSPANTDAAHGLRASGRLRVRSGWLVALATTVLAMAPWLPRARGLLDYPGWREPVPLVDVPLINLIAWTAGETPAELWTPAAVTVYLALAGAGAATFAARASAGTPVRAGDTGASAIDRRLATQRTMALFALAFVVAPLAVAAVAVVRQPDFHPRYFTAVLPALYLWSAAGAVRWRWPALRAAAVAALLLAAAPPLARMYGDPTAQKQDYRSLVALVERSAGHEDTVLFIDGPSYGLARRYEMADSPVKIVNLRSSGNLEQGSDERTAEIAELASEYPHLWLATTPEALGEAESWLAANAFAVDEPMNFQAISLKRYLGPRAPGAMRIPVTAGVVPVDEPLWASVAAPESAAAGAVIPIAVRLGVGARAGGRDRSLDGAPPGTRASIRLVDEAGAVVASADRALPPTHIGPSPETSPLRFGLTVPAGAHGRLTPEFHMYTPAGEIGRFVGSAVTVTPAAAAGE